MKITLRPTQKQFQAWEALKENKIVFFGGGAGGGKSWWLCETRLVNCYLYPGYKSFIAREELKRLMQSTYITWMKVCKHHGIPRSDWDLNGQHNYIQFKNGSRIDLLDVKYLPSDPLYERFGSTEYSDGAIEEAGEIHFLAYDVLKSRIGRHLNRELGIKPTLAITGNPKKNWTYREFYKPWKAGQLEQGIAFIQALYGDNPHTAETYGEQLSSIKDSSMRQRLRDGIWEYDEDDGVLIEYDAITDLWNNQVEDSLDKYLVADIARFGGDKTVIGLWKGLRCYQIITRQKQDTEQTALLIDELLREEGIPRSRCIIDEDGVGGGVVDKLRGVKGFVANSSPILENRVYNEFRAGELIKKQAKDNYFNLKAQCAWRLADKINLREIAISCFDETVKAEIEEELGQIKQKDTDTDKKLQLVPKDEVKENIGRSPDYGDMMIMRMYFELKGQKSYAQVEMTQDEKDFFAYKRSKIATPTRRIVRL